MPNSSSEQELTPCVSGRSFPAAWAFVRNEALFIPAAVLVLATMALVSPRANFALNDDWVYAKAVQSFLETGHFQQHPYAATIAVAMQMYGAIWAKLFGFSYTVLRLSTLSCLLVCLWATARCARELGMSRGAALVCSGIILCNPIVLNLGYTFMTDVSFMAAAALSTFFVLRALKDNLARDYALAMAFCVVAFFVRQFGAILAIALALTLAVRWWRTRQKVSAQVLLACLAPLAVGGLLLVAYSKTQANALMPGNDNAQRFLSEWLSKTPYYVAIAALYGGLFVLPVFFARIYQLLARAEKWSVGRWAAFVVFSALVTGLACHGFAYRLPMLPNILRDLGTGPLTMRDVYFWNHDWSPVRIGEWWRPVTWFAVLAAGMALTDMAWQGMPALWRTVRKGSKKKRAALHGAALSGQASVLHDQRVFLILVVIGMTLAQFNPIWPTILDRYLLTMLVPVVLLVGQAIRGRAGINVAAVGCAAIYLFSIAALQDYMAWNHAKWRAIDALLNEQKVDPFRLDGGYEYNGMYTSDKFRELAKSNSQGPMGQYLFDDTYALSFQPRQDYREIGRAPYFSWLDFSEHNILVLQRTRPSPQSLLPPLSPSS